ncbi:phosphotransferase [Actinoplanes sp. NPDC049316]|uniref:phosphotransferase family protein n=1 Tax=Actinoplanes sp. NPDC049316 TaxID=3154727 RepID=UPI00341FDE4A
MIRTTSPAAGNANTALSVSRSRRASCASMPSWVARRPSEALIASSLNLPAGTLTGDGMYGPGRVHTLSAEPRVFAQNDRMRRDWAALPESAMMQIEERVGRSHVIPASDGDHAEIAATVAGADARVFVKAAVSEFGVRSLRYELLVGRGVDTPYSPAVVWDFEADGWLVVGFEHVDGVRADLSSASAHLDLLDLVLQELAKTRVPRDAPLFSPSARFGFEHPAMHGDTLVHTDLNPANVIVTPAGVRVVDWAMATKAAPWVELAQLVAWLIGSGHTPQQAENWLARHPAWDAAGPETLDHFASSNAAKWSAKARQSNAPWMRDLATWTGQWSAYRRGQSVTSAAGETELDG